MQTTMAARASQAVAADSVPFARAKSTMASAIICMPSKKELTIDHAMPRFIQGEKFPAKAKYFLNVLSIWPPYAASFALM